MTNQEFIESIRLEGESWRDVVGYEGRYAVSSMGRIMCLSFDIITHPYGKEHILHRDAHLLKPTPFKSTGYLYVMFRENNIRHKYSVHRLVAKAFLPNPNNYPQIDHIDNVRTNNEVSNLRWCDAYGNMNNPITRKKISSGLKGRPSPKRIPVVQIDKGELVNQYASAYQTRESGFCPQCVTSCCLKHHKHHKGYQWMYLSDYEKQLVSMSKNSESI